MVMAENEAGYDPKEVKSPWKTPMIDTQKVADAPVMGTKSWPDLGGTQQPPDNASLVADGSAPAPSVEQVSHCFFFFWVFFFNRRSINFVCVKIG